MSESLRRGIQILEALRTSSTHLSARELAVRIGLPKSTVQRLLHTLEACDMATQDPRSRKYHLGPHTLTLGMAYRSRVDLRGIALPHMTRLRDLTGETVGLTVPVGGDRMYLEQVQSRSELRTTAPVGHPYPLWTGAPGRVLLASRADAEIADMLRQVGRPAPRAMDPPTEDAFWAAIAGVRDQGYATAFEETIPGISTVAAPVRDDTGTVVAALSIAGSSVSFDREAMTGVLAGLLRSADAITAELGGDPGPLLLQR
ncbi:MAG: IclR family transcriptional regulator [Streptosporangiaceae bacterium]